MNGFRNKGEGVFLEQTQRRKVKEEEKDKGSIFLEVVYSI